MTTHNTNTSKEAAALMWILAIFLSIFSSAFYFFTKKEDIYLHGQSKLALNLSINFFIAVTALSIVTCILASILSLLGTIGSLLMVVTWAGWAYICFLHYKSVKEGSPAPTIPYVISFIK